MTDFKPYTDRTPETLHFDEKKTAEYLKSSSKLKSRILRLSKVEGKYLVHFFDKHGVLRCRETTNVKGLAKVNHLTYNYTGHTTFYGYPKPAFPKVINGVLINRTWTPNIITSMCVDNDTIEDFVERYNFLTEHIVVRSKSYTVDWDAYYDRFRVAKKTASSTDLTLTRATKDQKIRDFILRIERPIFERETDNIDTKTFDFIRIRLSVPEKESMPERKEFIQKNLRGIVNVALTRIQDTKSYQRYGVPVSFLKLENAVLTADSQLELLFGLKTIRE